GFHELQVAWDLAHAGAPDVLLSVEGEASLAKEMRGDRGRARGVAPPEAGPVRCRPGACRRARTGTRPLAPGLRGRGCPPARPRPRPRPHRRPARARTRSPCPASARTCPTGS